MDQLTTFRSLDGLRLRGTFVTPDHRRGLPTVLVHGGGVTREEGGFFTRLAAGLGEAGIPNLRFDFRAHGESEGAMEEMTLAGVVNDIRAAADHLLGAVGGERVNIIGASFGGGLSAFFASSYLDRVSRLVLINPLLDYKRRFIDEKPHWQGDRLDDQAADALTADGYLRHSPTVRHGRALLNEVFYLQPHKVLRDVRAPVLIIHGSADTFIPVSSSRQAVEQPRQRIDIFRVGWIVVVLPVAQHRGVDWWCGKTIFLVEGGDAEEDLRA